MLRLKAAMLAAGGLLSAGVQAQAAATGDLRFVSSASATAVVTLPALSEHSLLSVAQRRGGTSALLIRNAGKQVLFAAIMDATGGKGVVTLPNGGIPAGRYFVTLVGKGAVEVSLRVGRASRLVTLTAREAAVRLAVARTSGALLPDLRVAAPQQPVHGYALQHLHRASVGDPIAASRFCLATAGQGCGTQTSGLESTVTPVPSRTSRGYSEYYRQPRSIAGLDAVLEVPYVAAQSEDVLLLLTF